jgi:hypothetical protein
MLSDEALHKANHNPIPDEARLQGCNSRYVHVDESFDKLRLAAIPIGLCRSPALDA